MVSQNNPKKVDAGLLGGCGCLGIIVILFACIFINDCNIRNKIKKEFEERDKLELKYYDQLEMAGRLCDKIAERGDAEEREKLSGVKDFFHIKEEASHGGSDEYRRETFEDLQISIKELTELLDVLEKNPQMSPTQAKEMVKDFRCF